MSRFPIYYQHDSMECGIACLHMICKHYGRDYSTATLSRYCHASTAGVSLLGLSEAGEQLGFKTVCGLLPLSQTDTLRLPCILHWDQNHYVVLYRVHRQRYYIADPARGLVTLTQRDMAEHWASSVDAGEACGVVMTLEPTSQFGRIDDSAHADSRSFRFLFGYIRQYRRYFGQIILGLLLGCVLQLVMPFLTQSIVDVGIRHQDISLVWLILLGELIIVVARTITDFIRRWLLLHISMRINISLVSDFFIKLLRLPMSYFDTKLMGDLVQRIDDHRRVQTFLTTEVLSVTFSLISFVVFGIVLFCYHPLIFAIFLIGSLLYGVWIMFFLRRRRRLNYEVFELQAQNQERTFQFLTSMPEIKLQDCERRRRWEWEDTQVDLFQVQMKSLRLTQSMEAGSIFLNELKNILITVLSATAVIHGEMTLGMMLAVQYIIGQLNSPVERLMSFINSLQDVRISLERINEIHRAQDEGSTPDQPNAEKAVPVSHADIQFSNVDFKYDPHAPTKVIDDVTFTIPQGRVTAIVGASGSGKTTLLKLLLGYYPPMSGSISVGDIDLSHIHLRSWRRQCGVVMQEGVIFSDTIARNIACADGEVDTERLVQAAQIACIDEYVQSLPLGYNTRIGRDGSGLSQGQRQRILIARAVYRNPQYILLDEATNALDANNERAIVENLDRFYQGRTCVVVAHRLSTVRHAHQIIVLDHGTIVEIGTHDQLIARQGTYYNLVKNQLELGN